ncbi:lamin tail domain-containing protein [Rossellomorea vietnamensis]|uniref:lamin tail domain-containing protein n=1 Tax=Rossellomorea vietnamensis TaxID=218284 RepID=UPI003D2A7A13
MKKVLLLITSLIIVCSLLPFNQASASTYSKATDAVVKAESYAGALKWEISYEYRKTAHGVPVWYPDMKLYNQTKDSLKLAENLIQDLPKDQKAAFQKRIDSNVKIHFVRAGAYIDAITSGLKIERKYHEFAFLFSQEPTSDKTEEAYHDFTREIRKNAVMLYRVYGQSTRDAILEKYKLPAIQGKNETIYAISAKVEMNKLNEMMKDNQPVGEQVDKIKEYLKQIQSMKAKKRFIDKFNSLVDVEYRISNLDVHFITVGEGDSTLIQSPNGKTMLIDGGSKAEGQRVLQYLKETGIQSLDWVVATHPDENHIGGLIDVVKNIEVKNYLDSGKGDASESYKELRTIIDEKRIPVTIAKEGEELDFDDYLKTKILNSGEGAKTSDEASIVLKVSYDSVDYLLTGDIPQSVEADIVDQYNIEAEILKVGSHGSDQSSSKELLSNAKAEFGIYSHGKDNYYQPDPSVLNRFKEYTGTTLYSTYESGTIVISTDGDIYHTNSIPWNAQGKKQERDFDNIGISSLNTKSEYVYVRNYSNRDISLRGWKLISAKNNKVYLFPDQVLTPGMAIRIVSGVTYENYPPQQYNWTTEEVFEDSGDSVQLLNDKGEVVDTAEISS